jgi:hypothetical protein
MGGGELVKNVARTTAFTGFGTPRNRKSDEMFPIYDSWYTQQLQDGWLFIVNHSKPGPITTTTSLLSFGAFRAAGVDIFSAEDRNGVINT